MYSILSYLWPIKNIHLQNIYFANEYSLLAINNLILNTHFNMEQKILQKKNLLAIKYIYWQQIYLLAINLFIGNKLIFFFRIRIYFPYSGWLFYNMHINWQ